MRIISKFKDYYDSAQAYGQDKSVVFVRKGVDGLLTQSLKDIFDRDRGTYRNPFRYGREADKFIESQDNVSVIFCGKMYRYILVVVNDRNFEHTLDKKPVKHVLKTYEEYVDFWNKHSKHLVKQHIPKYRHGYWHKKQIEDNKIAGKRYFNVSNQRRYMDWAVENQVVIAVETSISSDPYDPYGKYELLTNCELKEYGFQRILDSWQAYQEIDMFVGGVLTRPDSNMVQISDQDMAKKKGFFKRSFKHRV